MGRARHLVVVLSLFSIPALADQAADRALAREILRELIEIDTTTAHGDQARAARAMAKRLLDAGFPARDVQVLVGKDPKKAQLVARLRGTGKARPLLLNAHLDVVAARRADWTTDPFKLVERDGFFYGRGTQDMKADVAIDVATLVRLQRERLRPARDVILALTTDEEGGDQNGVAWLLQHHRPLVEAELALGEGGGGNIRNGRYLSFEVMTAEKTFITFVLETRDKGGHSALPGPENAIYRLAAGLARLARLEFPVRLHELTRAYLERSAAIEGGTVGADMRAVVRTPGDERAARRLGAKTPYYNAVMRTTCTATTLGGGHAENALPQVARATVNCRVLPWDSVAEVEKTVIAVLADPRITVRRGESLGVSPASPLDPRVMRRVGEATRSVWPGVPVVPAIMVGGTDMRHLRRAGIPSYGISALFGDVDDVRAHGKDERVGVRQYYEGLEFMYRLVKGLADGR